MKTQKMNKSFIMQKAWMLYKAQEIRTMEQFSISMKMAWNMAKEGKLSIPSFEKIYALYYKDVLNWYMFKFSSIGLETAKDLTNDTFLKVFQNLDKYNPVRSEIKTWIIVIAKRVIIDNYRHNKNMNVTNISNFVDEEGRETIQIADDSDSSDNVQNNEMSKSIKVAMSKLKPNYRKVAELFFIQQLKMREIAENLNMPLNSVKVAILRCREQLQGELRAVYNNV